MDIVIHILILGWLVSAEIRMRKINKILKDNKEASSMQSVIGFDEGFGGCGQSSDYDNSDSFPYGAV